MSNSLVLVEDLTPNQANIIEESSTDGKDTYLSGIFMQAEVQNGNGRNYPLEEITNAVTAIQGQIEEGHFIAGELNHPNDLSINLERVSHIITNIHMEGNNAIGKAKLLNTPMGVLAKNLMEGGLRLGVSSRGTGQVNESGEVSDFNFITLDIVATPSAPEAFPEGIRESLEVYEKAPEILKLSEAVVNDESAQKYLTKEIKAFIETLTQKR